MDQRVLDIADVSFAFPDSPKTVLQDIVLRVNKSDFLAIIGPNGGGKTTLIKLIIGEYTPLSGTITVLGKTPCLGCQDIGYVPQFFSFEHSFPITVYDVVLMGRLKYRRFLRRYSPQDHNAVMNTIDTVRLTSYARNKISTLSGGQLQRMVIAQALVSQPKILILDEPTASVDIRAEREIFNLLKTLSETIAIIIVSHDIHFISHYVRNVACLNRKMSVHPAEEVTHSTIYETYGHPIVCVDHKCDL